MTKKNTQRVERGDVLRIAAEGRVDIRTVSNAYAGGNVRRLSLERIAEAAKKLGLPLPPGVLQ